MSARHATACIIGAGSSGITAAQVLQAEGIDFDCFEMGSGVGGNWRYDNDNGVSSAYRSLHINTSREAMEYAAWPMPASLPDYPSHWQIAAVLRRLRRPLRAPRRDHVPHRGDQGGAGRGRRVGRHDPAARRRARGRDPALRPRAGRQRPPLGPALAGAVVPGQRELPGRADPRALLPHARGLRRQAGRGAGHRQLRDATSRSRRRGTPRRRTWRCGAVPGSSRSTCSACRPTTSPTRRSRADRCGSRSSACARCCGSPSAR